MSGPISPGWKERLAALRNVPWVLRLAWEADKLGVLLGLFLRAIVACVPLATLAIARLIVDDVVVVVRTAAPIPPHFWWFVAAEFSIAAMGAIITQAIAHLNVVLVEKYLRHVSLRVMGHAASLDLATYEDPAFHDKLERARSQATDRLRMVMSIGTLTQQLVTGITLATSIALFSPWILVLLIGCGIPSVLAESHYAMLAYMQAFDHVPARRQLDYLRVLGASKESAKELKIFGLSSFIMSRYATISGGLLTDQLALARRIFFGKTFMVIIGTTGYYGGYVFAIHQVLTGQISIGTFTFLAGAIASANHVIQEGFKASSIIVDESFFIRELLGFFAEQPAVRSGASSLPVPRPIKVGIEFRDVSFQYPGRDTPVLDHVSFMLTAGERCALIGENGQGKTTIVKLLLRLVDPTGGQILLDGIDLREYSVDDLRREMGVIFQDFMRFEMTAAQNIAMGRVEDRDDRPRIEAAAAKSLANEVIDGLPEKYEQMLGRRFDHGVELSGGEWQKIALARAYLRDAQVLVLDEPTAALDARSEGTVFERFAELTQGKIVVLISHRFSTVRMADKILVLEAGRIREEGNHEQLMAKNGRYAELFEMQASRYR
jgi:ATP-binding cassette subfamily B protein